MVESPNPQRFSKDEPVWFCFDVWEGIIRANIVSVMSHPNFDICTCHILSGPYEDHDDFNICNNLLFGNYNDLSKIVEQKKSQELQAYVKNMPDMDSVIKVMYEALKTGEGCDNAMLRAFQTQVKNLSGIDL